MLPALAGFVLFSLDPLHAANSRFFHLDALQSALMLLAVVALLSRSRRATAEKTVRRRDLLVSSVAAALAVLTKTPSLLLLVVGPAIIALDAYRHRNAHQDWVRRAIRSTAAWGAVFGVVAVLMWPALWSGPRWVATEILNDLMGHAADRYDTAIYLHGRMTENPSSLLFYLTALQWHASPAFWVGLLLTALAIWRRWPPLDRPVFRFTVFGLLAVGVSYLAAVVVAGTTALRYVLPAYLFLMVAAGVAWVAFLSTFRRGWARAPAIVLCAAVLGLQLHAAASSYPFYLTYTNPLMGDRAGAFSAITQGRGEGLSEAARFLDSLPDSEHATVMTRYAAGAFSYFYRGPAIHLPGRWDQNAAEQIRRTNYVVLYFNQKYHGNPSRAFVNYFMGLTPIHVVTLHGIEYARIYRIDGPRVASELDAAHRTQTR
jgi:hypothetical protein